MGIFNFLKKKNPKNKYQVYYDSIFEVLNLLKWKKEMVENLHDGDSELDFSFDQNMMEQMAIIEIIRSGSVSFLGVDFKNYILKIYNDSEVKKDQVMYIWNYLLNEQNKLSKVFNSFFKSNRKRFIN